MMSKTLIAIAVLLAVALAAAAAWWVLTRAPAHTPQAPAVAEAQRLPPFREIVLEGGADVVLVQGDSERIAIDAPGRSVVHAEVRDGVLAIRAVDDRHWWGYLLGAVGHGAPKITVTFRDLDALRASGAIGITAEPLRAGALAMRLSGAASVTLPALEARSLAVVGSGAFTARLAGRVDEQRVSISGAGDYRAGDLVSERAFVVVSGAGQVVVHARRTLDVELSGAGKVDYKGDPKVTQSVKGAARIHRLDSSRRMMPLARARSMQRACA
jgi:hypothetical protein